MQKQTAVGIILGTILFVGLSAGAYFLLQLRQNDTPRSTAQKKPAVDVSLKTTKPATENTPATGSTLQVQGASTTQQSTQQSQASQFPTPDQFTAYEQFSKAETTQFQDSVVGTGAEATTGDTVAVAYKGWLTNGTLFDQSSKNEQNQIVPITFTLGSGQVITGWEQGILGMKEGGKRRLIIPSQLGYGAAGQGQQIPPNSMLIFDVELVQVQKP